LAVRERMRYTIPELWPDASTREWFIGLFTAPEVEREPDLLVVRLRATWDAVTAIAAIGVESILGNPSDRCTESPAVEKVREQPDPSLRAA
jgi:hypothetical protein